MRLSKPVLGLELVRSDLRFGGAYRSGAVAAPRLRMILLVYASALLGCSTTQQITGDQLRFGVHMHASHMGNEKAYGSARNVRYQIPQPLESNATPIYPASQIDLADARNVIVNVRLVVDASGTVERVFPIDDNLSVYGPDSDFVKSVISTCMTWRFSPLVRTSTEVVPDGAAFDVPQVRVVTINENLPFSLTYQFIFTSNFEVEGQASTE